MYGVYGVGIQVRERERERRGGERERENRLRTLGPTRPPQTLGYVGVCDQIASHRCRQRLSSLDLAVAVRLSAIPTGVRAGDRRRVSRDYSRRGAARAEDAQGKPPRVIYDQGYSYTKTRRDVSLTRRLSSPDPAAAVRVSAIPTALRVRRTPLLSLSPSLSLYIYIQIYIYLYIYLYVSI